MTQMSRATTFSAITVTLLVGACMGTSSGTMQSSTAGSTAAGLGPAFVQAATDSAAGQYLTIVGGCNDCHTVGWAESNGRTPPAEQLTGSNVGYRGPWGTSYAANLRNVVQRASEDRWVQILTTADGGHGRPPMPWMNTAAMSQHDLRAVYRYVHSLGARGANAPRAVPPDSTPRTPYINFAPVQP
jgi:cytochrome c1